MDLALPLTPRNSWKLLDTSGNVDVGMGFLIQAPLWKRIWSHLIGSGLLIFAVGSIAGSIRGLG